MNTDRNNLIWSQRRHSLVIDPATDQLREVRMRIWTLVRTVLEYAAPYSLVGYTLQAPQKNRDRCSGSGLGSKSQVWDAKYIGRVGMYWRAP